MPAKVVKRGSVYRVVDPNGKITKNKGGTAVDGKGHATREAAQRQANAINRNLYKSN